MTSLMPNYSRLPVNFSHGEGVWLWDSEGKRYLDALSGIAVCGLGHAHPALAEAICAQAKQLLHTSNLYGVELQTRLADMLTRLSGLDSVFFANSGAEANEAALKIARRTGRLRGIEVPKVVVMEGSFHGRTMATLSATGNPKVQHGFEPLVQGFIRVPYGNLESLERLAKSHPDIVAVLIEPVQGEGGINIPADDYLPAVRALCDQHDWLLMLDEIQTGMGRTGQWFAFQHYDFKPDVMTLAKALGNGVPIGACLARGEAAQCLQPGTHGSTFGGNPLACRAALAVLETMETEQLCTRAEYLGRLLQQGFQNSLGTLPGVQSIRNKGLMIGIELDRPCAGLVTQALDAGLLINVTADKVIRLLPPLILSDAEAEQIVAKVSELVKTFLSAA